VCGAGVLLLLPALLEQGLLRTKEVYHIPENHYYGLESIVLTLAFMALCRIKNPEQLKQCKPGEIGRIIGLDRVPEVRCLREKINLLVGQGKAQDLNNILVDHWYKENSEDAQFLYIDGHQRIYYGEKANLPAKFISRQKLCLSATTEFWVNDAQGMPVMMVIGELSEKLQHIIEDSIIPQMLQTSLLTPIDESNAPSEPQCTLIFDREAYEPAFFQRLWQRYRIAIITYRKHVKDIWEENKFKSLNVRVLENNVNMHLCEQNTNLGGHAFREIRRLSAGGHQTAIITTHPSIETATVAGRMFARWGQENFFRYLIADYDFDKMAEFGVQELNPEKLVVNPEYRSLTHQLKKINEKIGRLEAQFFPLAEKVIDLELDEIPKITQKQADKRDQIITLNNEKEQLKQKRVNCAPKIKLSQMPEEKRYNQLKTESKLLLNVIKMICYRAESAVVTLISPSLSRAVDEKRMFIKQIIQNNADLIPDYSNNTLTVKLHSLSAPRFNNAAQKLCEILNETQTLFPGSNLRLIYKTTAQTFCEG
jgi:hypothetical protein